MAQFNTEFITIQDTNLATITTSINTQAEDGFALLSFIPVIDSSDVITYTALMSKTVQ